MQRGITGINTSTNGVHLKGILPGRRPLPFLQKMMARQRIFHLPLFHQESMFSCTFGGMQGRSFVVIEAEDSSPYFGNRQPLPKINLKPCGFYPAMVIYRKRHKYPEGIRLYE